MTPEPDQPGQYITIAASRVASFREDVAEALRDIATAQQIYRRYLHTCGANKDDSRIDTALLHAKWSLEALSKDLDEVRQEA